MNFETSIQAFVASAGGSGVPCQIAPAPAPLPLPSFLSRSKPLPRSNNGEDSQPGGKTEPWRFAAFVGVLVYPAVALSIVSIAAWDGRRANEMQERSRGVGVKDTTPHFGLSQVSAGRTGARTRRRSQTGCGTVLARASGSQQGRDSVADLAGITYRTWSLTTRRSASAGTRRHESRGWRCNKE